MHKLLQNIKMQCLNLPAHLKKPDIHRVLMNLGVGGSQAAGKKQFPVGRRRHLSRVKLIGTLAHAGNWTVNTATDDGPSLDLSGLWGAKSLCLLMQIKTNGTYWLISGRRERERCSVQCVAKSTLEAWLKEGEIEADKPHWELFFLLSVRWLWAVALHWKWKDCEWTCK